MVSEDNSSEGLSSLVSGCLIIQSYRRTLMTHHASPLVVFAYQAKWLPAEIGLKKDRQSRGLNKKLYSDKKTHWGSKKGGELRTCGAFVLWNMYLISNRCGVEVVRNLFKKLPPKKLNFHIYRLINKEKLLNRLCNFRGLCSIFLN